MKKSFALLLLTGFVLSGCAFSEYFIETQKTPTHLQDYKKLDSADYITQLSSLADIYLQTPGIWELELNPKDQQYFQTLYRRIRTNNELLLSKNIEPRFHVIKDNAPFIFSLPSGEFFLSDGLIHKYCKSEDILYSLLTYEIIRVHRDIYPRSTIVPVGYLKTERFLNLLRIPSETKVTLNKWAFYALKRAGLDGGVYLNWLQLQNKNVLDFGIFLGDTRSISREEFIFKNFIIQEGLQINKTKNSEINSSPDFYTFINKLEKSKIKVWKRKS